jgi:DNA repair protein RecO (recombination protein O)
MATTKKIKRSPSVGPKERVEQASAFVLHSIAWKETSLIVDIFTRDYGKISVVAKGAKRPNSVLRAVNLAFQPIRISWLGANELRTLTKAEWQGGLPAPQGTALLCSFYLNELLVRLLARDDPYPNLFDAYHLALSQLAADPSQVSDILRRFEWALLRETGYAIDLEHDQNGQAVMPSEQYRLIPAQGLVRQTKTQARAGYHLSQANQGLILEGRQVLAIASENFSDPATATKAKAMMRLLMSVPLEGQSLKTRQILRDLQKL